jgi:hypothetical protein
MAGASTPAHCLWLEARALGVMRAHSVGCVVDGG